MNSKRKTKALALVILILVVWFAAVIALMNAKSELCKTLGIVMFLLPAAAGLFFKIRGNRIAKKEYRNPINDDRCYSFVFLNDEQQKLAVCRAVSRGSINDSTIESASPDEALEMLEKNGYILRLPKRIATAEFVAELEEFLLRRGYEVRLSEEDILAHQPPAAAERREKKLDMWQYDLGAAAVILREYGLELIELSTNAVYYGNTHYLIVLSFEDYLRMNGCMVFDAKGGSAK